MLSEQLLPCKFLLMMTLLSDLIVDIGGADMVDEFADMESEEDEGEAEEPVRVWPNDFESNKAAAS